MRIDTSTIQGYADMTPEEKVAALEAHDLPEGDSATAKKYKDEAKKWKEKHDALLSDDERRAQEKDNMIQTLTAERDDLRRKNTISEHRATLASQGWDDTLASEGAIALADGDYAKFFANQKKHDEALEAKVKADVLRTTPRPAGGTGTNAADYQKKIAEAQARGDMAAVAALMRAQQQENN